MSFWCRRALPLKPRTVLVVDDEEDMRELASVFLEMNGAFQVRTAPSGADALLQAAEQRPDAILLDFMMPDMDGPETFRRLRADASMRDVPVVFLTAKTGENVARDLKMAGAAGVIAKPFNPMTLESELQAILEALS